MHLPHSSPPKSIWFLLPSRLLENRPLQLPRGPQQDFNWGLKSTKPGCSAGTALANPAGTGRRSSAGHQVLGTPPYGAPLFYCPHKQAVLVQGSPQGWGLPPSSGAQLSPSPACPGCWEALSAHQAHCSLPPSWGVFGAQGCFCSALSASPGGCEQPPHATLTPAPLLPHHEALSTSRGFFIWSRASLPSTAVVGGGFDRVPKLLPARSQAGLFATSKGGGDLHHHTPGDEQHPGLQHHRTEGCGMAACATTTARHVVGCPIGLGSTACRGSSVTLNPA